ncbi:MAG: hypothetical protein RIS73_1743, partial [Bacteroidota bacterium]
IVIALFSCKSNTEKAYQGWQVYGGNNEHNHYSSLTEIDTNNVAGLKAAWIYHTNDTDRLTQIQVNPIIVDGIMYGVSPKLKLFALDAATGTEKWTFDPAAFANADDSKAKYYFAINVCRGVTYYRGNKDDQRIFYAAASNLYCVDALTGKPINSFGDKGKIDLHNDLGREVKNLYLACTSPGIIYKDLIIVGSRVMEDAAAAPGHIRAYDVHSGKLRWIFHTIPQPGEPGYESWDNKEAYKHIGGANAWAGFSMDEKKGIVYAPVGSASYDFYGGKRTGDNLFANCVLALDAATGKRIWHYQTVHHDIWDRDLPTAPALVTITKDGKKIDALAQPTKTGFIFLLDRNTGKPIYPINETAVPSISELVGEKPSLTQPMPTLSFTRQLLTEKDLNSIVPDSSYQDIKKRLKGYKTGNIYNPPSRQGTVIFPGTDGGAEWGGPAYDPTTGILYINANEIPWVLTMVDVKNAVTTNETNFMAGQRLYAASCMGCHGPERTGAGNNPSLIGVNKKYNEEQLIRLLSAGRRMMPAFNQLAENEKKAIASFILDNESMEKEKFIAVPKAEDEWLKMPYTSTGYNKFLTKEGYPAVAPPWGTLNAINLNTGQLIWKETLGDYPELKAKGIHSGTENYGGPAVTAGGLLFIAATSDAKMRAFNKRTGKLLWETDLPACGYATPSVYEVNGRQFIVIACGGGKLGKKSGDAYIAFALAENK